MARRGRRPQVSYWNSRKGYGFNYNGRAHIFQGPEDFPDGPTYRKAVMAYTKLITQDKDKGSDQYKVSCVLNSYHQFLRENERGNAKRYGWIGASFAEKYGTMKVADVRPFHLTDWLSENQERWGDTSRRAAAQLIMSAFAFARRRGLVESDPFAGRLEPDDLPAPVVRGEEARMSEELMDLIISEAKHHSTMFAAFLTILRQTGCRPGELRRAQPKHYRGGRITYRWNATDGITHKTAKKTRRDRVIYLSPAACATLDNLVAKQPKGAIFHSGRSPLGWTQQAVSHRWRYVIRRPKVVAYCQEHGINPEELKLYNFRHTFISALLEADGTKRPGGGDYYFCSQLCGTSVAMLERRYGHPNTHKMHERYLAYIQG